MSKIIISDVEINQKLSEIVNNSFISFKTKEIVEFVNNLLPEFSITKDNKFVFNDENIFKTVDKDNLSFPLTSLEMKNEKTSVNVFKDGHIQISTNNTPLFIEKEELKKMGMDDDASFIIGNGIRGLDPYDQKNWAKTKVGSEWPTSSDTRTPSGVVNLFTDKNKSAIMFTSPKSVGQNYGTNPRGIVIPTEDSLIIVFQQENNNPDIAFAAWSIAPFKIPQGKKAIAIFAYDEKEIYECLKNSSQYKIKNNFVILDSSENGEMAEHISQNVNIVLFAVEGSTDVYLMRSVFNEKNAKNDKFKAFSLGGSSSKYFELEFIAPQIAMGEKSTLAYKLELISLSSLGLNPFSAQDIENRTIDLFNQLISAK